MMIFFIITFLFFTASSTPLQLAYTNHYRTSQQRGRLRSKQLHSSNSNNNNSNNNKEHTFVKNICLLFYLILISLRCSGAGCCSIQVLNHYVNYHLFLIFIYLPFYYRKVISYVFYCATAAKGQTVRVLQYKGLCIQYNVYKIQNKYITLVYYNTEAYVYSIQCTV